MKILGSVKVKGTLSQRIGCRYQKPLANKYAPPPREKNDRYSLHLVIVPLELTDIEVHAWKVARAQYRNKMVQKNADCFDVVMRGGHYQRCLLF